MITTLQNLDSELDFFDMPIQDIIDSITLEDVKFFLESLGVESIFVCEEKDYLICPTICHNRLDEEASMKLYWYNDNKIFRCYTECNEVMTIFQLYQKVMKLNYAPVNFDEAVDYVKKCIKHLTFKGAKKHKANINFQQYTFDARVPVLQEYPKSMLTYFSNFHHPAWLKDGIKPDVMDKFHIGFSINQNKITIPHLDINGRLVGIRGRAIDSEDIELYGKYRPMQVGEVLYSHPLHFNLYGIYEHQNAIKAQRSAIIAEAEKSVLLSDGYYGDLSTTVACCGSVFNKYHINLLTNILGANEITIAFDKEYSDWRTSKAREYREKIERLCRKFKSQAVFYYIWDIDNLLQEKDSPFDRGKDIFEQLYKNRIKVR